LGEDSWPTMAIQTFKKVLLLLKGGQTPSGGGGVGSNIAQKTVHTTRWLGEGGLGK